MTLKSILEHANATLLPYTQTPRLDAEVLLAHVLKKSRTYLYTYPNKEISSELMEKFVSLLKKRQEGIPIAYLIGKRDFWSFELMVNEKTLIPRPETELLVELGLKLLPQNESMKVLDLGTGSGAIALALALERPSWQVEAVDKDPETLRIAQRNAKRLKLSNIKFLESDWFCNPILGNYDLIVSNPPYIAEQDPHLQLGDVRFEPKLALVSGMEGLDAINKIIEESFNHLLPHGVLLLEHGFDQKKAIVKAFLKKNYKKVTNWLDLQGNERVSGGWRN